MRSARRSIVWLVMVVAIVGCQPSRPSLAEWQRDVWRPLVNAVPTPEEADAARCQSALSSLRELGTALKPAPNPEIGAAADRWLRAAESLVFDCSSGSADMDFGARSIDVDDRLDEVEVLFPGS